MIRTKIICTAGPSVHSKAKLKNLILKGASIIRLNCSHGDTQSRLFFIKQIRQIETELKQPIGIMLDLQGPKLRVGDLPEPFELNINEIWCLSLKKKACAKSKIIPVSFKDLPEAVSINGPLYMDDGFIGCTVVKKDSNNIWIKIINGGTLNSRKGINIPYYKGRISVLNSKDKEDIKVGLKHDVDFIALSFVRHANDIAELKKFIHKQSPDKSPLIIAKIEKPEAVIDMDAIIQISDGVLVARGDLGIELSLPEVPVVQKKIIEQARFFKKPVIVATQMLDSMRYNPLPTRAEVSDVASAIFSGADAVLLTGETSAGHYPDKATAMLKTIIDNVEEHLLQKNFRKTPEDFSIETTEEATLFNIMQLAEDIKAKAIVMLTRYGNMTRVISKLHPKQMVFAVAENTTKYRQMSLLWGVAPLSISQKQIVKKIHQAIGNLKKNKQIKKSDSVIFIYRDKGANCLSFDCWEVK